MSSGDADYESNSVATQVSRQDRLLHQVLLGGFAALLVATPFLPSDTYSIAMEGQIAAPAMLWLMLGICAMIAWLLKAARRGGGAFSLTLADVGVGLFFTWVVAAGVLASSDGNRRAGWNMSASWATLGLTYALARLLLTDSKTTRAIVVGIVAITLLFSVEGLHEAFVSIPQQQAQFRKNPAAMLAEAGLDAAPGSAVYDQFKSRLETKGAAATFALENSFAGFLLPGLLLLFTIPFSGGKRAAEHVGLYRMAVLLGAISLIALCLRFTYSTAAMVSIVVSLLVGGLWLFSRRSAGAARYARGASVILLVGIFIWPLLAGMVGPNLTSSLPKTLKYRAEYWQSCGAMFAHAPLWGCGPGNFQDAYALVKLPQASETIADPHNLLWEVLCTSGAPAAALFVLGIGAALWPILSRSIGFGSRASHSSIFTVNVPSLSLRSMVIGAALGIPLALLLSLSASGNFLIYFLQTSLLLGAIPVVLLVLGLRGWINDGQLGSSATWLAWLALAIHLSVSGGVSNPGIGTLFFLLLALSQVGMTPRAGVPSRGTLVMGISGLVLLFVAGFAHYQYGYVPVLANQAARSRAEVALLGGRRGEAKDAFRAAAKVDPWSVKDLHDLAQLELQTYLEDATDSRADWEDLASVVQEAEKRSPRSPALDYDLAIYLLRAHIASPKPELLAESERLFEKTIKLSPTRAVAYAYLAFNQFLAGKKDSAALHAKTALQLDLVNPHEQYDLEREPCPVAGRSFPGWLRELAATAKDVRLPTP